MIQLKTIIPTIKSQYYYDQKEEKVYSSKNGQYKEMTLDGNSVRLSTELNKRVRYTIDFIKDSIPKQVVGQNIRIQSDDLVCDNLWHEYATLLSFAETDFLNKDSHVKKISKTNALSVLIEKTGASPVLAQEVLHQILNRPSITAEDDFLVFRQFKEGFNYVDLEADEVDGFIDYDLEVRIVALFKMWSKGGSSQITFNLKQIAHFLNVEYNNGTKRRALLEAVKRVSNKNLINVKERFIQTDGYGYVMFTGTLRPRPTMSPYESVLQEILNQYGDKSRSEEFIDALAAQLKASLI